MKRSILLQCCPSFLGEIQAVVAASRELSGIQVETYSIACRQNSQQIGLPLPDITILPPAVDVAIVGGGCLHGADAQRLIPAGAVLLSPQLCFHLVAPSMLVNSLLAEGAYLMTPGWLADWQRHLAEWGFDRETAGQFFRETTRKLLLLDTGIKDNCQLELSAMGEYLDLPTVSIPIGLDFLKLSLERLVIDMHRDTAQAPPTDKAFADHLMVIDLLNDLLTATSERQALDHIEEMFNLLFAPGRLNFIPAEDEKRCGFLWSGDDFIWTASGRGFVIPLHYREDHLGSLEIDDLAFAEYRDRYLTMAIPLAQVCAMAITNARAQEIRRNSEQALKRTASIVESSDDAIIGKTLDGIIVSWNQGAEKIYGYRESEVLGRSTSFLTPADQPNEITRLIEKVKDGQSADQAETKWLTKDGRLLDISLQVSPIRDDLGHVVGASSIARDITAEKQKIEQERRALEAQLQQSQKLESVGRLAGGVAHDFNNMLAVILGYTELILDETPQDSDMYRSLEEIYQAAERAKGLTRQLLAFARKQVLEMTSLNINKVIIDFSKMIKRLIGEDVEIKLLLEKDIPDIMADSAMVEQILMNLAVNARDAMPDGGALTIETKVVSLDEGYAAAKVDVISGDYLMLAVTDTGHGMDELTRERIFEPFFTTKEPGKGTGLGLSTVYGIAKQHGGHIWVYSEPGYGTIFKIYFPLSRTEIKTGAKQLETAPVPAQGETILVVEDETRLRTFFCSVLSKLGYRVLSAESPTEAQHIGMQHQGRIHLMLTDVVMPEMNGKALYEILAPHNPDMQVVFMSGYTENVVAQRGVLQEGINFIQKPFSINQLAVKLGSVLAQARRSIPKH